MFVSGSPNKIKYRQQNSYLSISLSNIHENTIWNKIYLATVFCEVVFSVCLVPVSLLTLASFICEKALSRLCSIHCSPVRLPFLLSGLRKFINSGFIFDGCESSIQCTMRSVSPIVKLEGLLLKWSSVPRSLDNASTAQLLPHVFRRVFLCAPVLLTLALG